MNKLILFCRKCIYFLLHFISPFVAVLSKISFVIFLILTGIVALVFNDQANDLFVSFAEDQLSNAGFYMTFFTLVLILWAHCTWLSTRIIFILADMNLSFDHISRNVNNLWPKLIAKEKLINLYTRWIPRILCFVTYLNIVWAYMRANKNNGFHLYPYLILLIGIIHTIYVIQRSNVMKRLQKGFSKEENELLKKDTAPKGIREIIFKDPSYRVSLIVCTVALLVLTIFLLFYDVRLYLRSGTIILTAFATYTFLAFVVDWAFNRWQLPSLMTIGLLFVIFSNFNNNHQVKDSGEATSAEVNNRMSSEEYFRIWLQYKINHAEIDTTKENIPVVLIASEGGGSRAAYWTTSLLEKLHKEIPGLYDHTFIASGVSGGNVGLGIFYSYLNGKKEVLADSNSMKNIEQISSGDFLSNVTYGFVFPDMLQRFLPYPFKNMDRGKFLLKSFDSSFSIYSNKNNSYQLHNSFLAAWKEETKFEKPCLLLNSTHVEKGRKVIFSPFKLSSTYYADVEDMFSVINRSVPVSEVMTSCSRFPGILPPGLIYSYNGNKPEKWGHLVDGGYFENTAVETCLQTKLMMESVLKKEFSSISNKVKILIVSIQIFKEDKKTDALGILYESAPLNTVMKVPFRWMWSADSIAHIMDKSYNEIVFNLVSYKNRPLPLGWYLSETSRREIRSQAEHISKPVTYYDSLNEKKLQELKKIFR